MHGASFGALMSLMKKRRPTKKCERCGLGYPEKEEHCPHCHDISDADLPRFKEWIAQQGEKHRRMGKMFFVAAIALVALMVLINM